MCMQYPSLAASTALSHSTPAAQPSRSSSTAVPQPTLGTTHLHECEHWHKTSGKNQVPFPRGLQQLSIPSRMQTHQNRRNPSLFLNASTLIHHYYIKMLFNQNNLNRTLKPLPNFLYDREPQKWAVIIFIPNLLTCLLSVTWKQFVQTMNVFRWQKLNVISTSSKQHTNITLSFSRRSPCTQHS